MSENKKKFKAKLRQFVKIDQEIEKMNKKLKKLKEMKNSISPEIMKYMGSKNLDEINLNSDYVLKLTKTYTFNSFNKKYLTNNISRFTNDGEYAEKLIEYLYEKRNKNEKRNLTIKKK